MSSQPSEDRALARRQRAAAFFRSREVHATQTFGPPPRTSAEACASYFLKFSRNRPATFFAFSSYAALSVHVLRGWRSSAGTSGHEVGTWKPNTGSSTVGTLASVPAWIASMIARVYF